jgi:hypothetical protein
MMKLDNLARNIAADLLAERPKLVPAPRCFACDHEYTPGQSGGDDSTRFCSTRCREAFDAGLPRNVDLPTPVAWLAVDTSRMVQVAGPPIPRCDACGGLCVELYRKRGKTFCNWRCRDGKPRFCKTCGESLYNSGRKGPYCSTTCANARGVTGRKTAKRPPGAKPQNSASGRPVKRALLKPVFDTDIGPDEGAEP